MEEGYAFVRSIIKPKTGELNTRTTFHGQMAHSFNLDEIRQICFDLKVNYENLPGETLNDKCRELYLYMERRGDLVILIATCQAERPGENWTVT